MLDKTSKNVLKILINEFNEKQLEYLYYSEYCMLCSDQLNISEREAMSCINYLEEQGYAEDLDNDGFRLKHKANHLDEFKTIDAINYIKSNWIAIIALVTSIVALIKSFFF